MKVTDFFSDTNILIGVCRADTKDEFLACLVAEAVSRGLLPTQHQQEILDSLLAREGIGSSGIGEGVAIPHCRSEWVTAPVVLLATVPDGVLFDAIDQQPVRIAALLVYPEQERRTYVQALAMVSRILRDRNRREALIHSSGPSEFLDVIRKEEKEEAQQIPAGLGHVLLLVLHEERYYDAGLEAFAELGIVDASVIESVTVSKKLQDYLPLYAGLLGTRKKHKHSRMIVGLTRDPQAGKKLMTLLGKVGCDLLRPETGAIAVIPAADVLGGLV